MSSLVLVTGYGGFLGKAICQQLIARGYHVRGLARNRYDELAKIGVEAIVGDASDADVCHAASKSCDGIIHTAAIASVGGDRKVFERINVSATESLIAAAQSQSVPAFVYCSSPSVVFAGQPQCNIDESTPYPTRWLADYPRTKAIAEAAVLASNSSSLQTCSLRPHLIWGQGDNHLTPRLIDRSRQNRLRIVGNGKNVIDTVHVDSAARAHVLALEKLWDKSTDVSGKPFFVTDGQPIQCWQWIANILHTAGQVPPTKRISINAAYRLGHALELVYRAFNIQSEPPMTRFVALQLGLDHYYNIDAARNALGYDPTIDRDATLQAMASWLRSL